MTYRITPSLFCGYHACVILGGSVVKCFHGTDPAALAAQATACIASR